MHQGFFNFFLCVTVRQCNYATAASVQVISRLVFIARAIILIREIFKAYLVNVQYSNIEYKQLCMFHD